MRCSHRNIDNVTENHAGCSSHDRNNHPERDYFAIASDVHTAFLHADIDQELYGCRNAPKLWERHVVTLLESLYYHPLLTDPSGFRNDELDIHFSLMLMTDCCLARAPTLCDELNFVESSQGQQCSCRWCSVDVRNCSRHPLSRGQLFKVQELQILSVRTSPFASDDESRAWNMLSCTYFREESVERVVSFTEWCLNAPS